MVVYYRRGYDPEEVLDIVTIRPARTYHRIAWLVLVDSEGQSHDATYLREENQVWVAGLPENW